MSLNPHRADVVAPIRPTVWQQNAEAFATSTNTEGLSAYVDALIAREVRVAAGHYKAHQPGRGLWTLTRLGQRLQRLHDATHHQEVPQ